MRQNMNEGQRLLSIFGGLAFIGLGMSKSNTFMGKVCAIIGAKTALVGLIGYDPLLELADE